MVNFGAGEDVVVLVDTADEENGAVFEGGRGMITARRDHAFRHRIHRGYRPHANKCPRRGIVALSRANREPEVPEMLSPPARSTCPLKEPEVIRFAVWPLRAVIIGPALGANEGEVPSVRISAVGL